MTPAFLRLTFPIVRRALWSSRVVLAVLVFLSLVLGVIPTLKSEFESGLLGQINNELRNRSTLERVLQQPLDRFRPQRDNDSGAGLPERLARRFFTDVPLLRGLAWYALLVIFGLLLEVASARATAGVAMEVFRALRLEGFKRGLEGDQTTLTTAPNMPGQYASAIHQGATNAKETYEYLLEGAQQLVSIVTVIGLLATRSKWLSVGCVLLVVVQASISVLQARRLRAARNLLDVKRNDLVARTDDILSKREIVLAHEQQGTYATKLDHYAADYAEVVRRLAVREALYEQFGRVVSDYGRVAVLLMALVIGLLFSGPAVANIGDAYFLISLYVRLLVPVSNLLRRYDSIRRSEATSRTYLELLAQPDSGDFAPSVQAPQDKDGPAVEFENVGFGYGTASETPVLTTCTFRVPPGSVTLLLGPSGSGKTTIARLLLAFRRPRSGRILIDGQDSATMTAPDIRLLMSYVSQGDYIIDDTVRENLSWSMPAPTEAAMAQALAEVRIADVAKARTLLDRPARSLSIGQQQRLSLCRVVLDRAPLLILDEPLTGVDAFTIRDVIPMLIRAISDTHRTVLLISHRIAFVSQATHVVVLNGDGSVAEEGSPSRLLADPTSTLHQLHALAAAEIGISAGMV